MTFHLKSAWHNQTFNITLDQQHQINIGKMDAELFTIIPFDSNGNLYKKLNQQSQRKDKNHLKIETNEIKSPIYTLISGTLTRIFYVELICLVGFVFAAFILCIASKIDKRYNRLVKDLSLK